MNEMCRIIPFGSCPNCGHKQFIIYESTQNIYLTNRDGEVIDYKESYHNALGMCVKCKEVYNMIEIKNGFIPSTELRKILFDYTPHSIKDDDVKITSNPMEG